MNHVDIVIVNYNTLSYLRDCLQSIAAYTHTPYRLILIDNASTDGSSAYLRQLEQRGDTVHVNRENLGCARAWNQGIRLGTGELILFLNPDTVVTPGWLTGMVELAQSDPRIAVVGNKQVNANGVIIHAGVVEEEGRARYRGIGEMDAPDKYTEVQDCIDVCGACYLIKRKNLPVIGYFDEQFFLYAEETDYSFRARALGFRVVYYPHKIIHYKDGAPISFAERERLHRRSCQLFDQKWFHGGGDG